MYVCVCVCDCLSLIGLFLFDDAWMSGMTQKKNERKCVRVRDDVCACLCACLCTSASDWTSRFRNVPHMAKDLFDWSYHTQTSTRCLY